jgi:hypothetical protein
MSAWLDVLYANAGVDFVLRTRLMLMDALREMLRGEGTLEGGAPQ